MKADLKIRKLQVARRVVQFSALALIIFIPIVARYSNYILAREIDENIERWNGTAQGRVIGATDAFFRAMPEGEVQRGERIARNNKKILSHIQNFRGGTWSAQLGPLSLTDPLAGAESIVAGKSFVKALLISLLIPVIATVLLGRIFCSWICPMNLLLEFTEKLRRAIEFLEIKPGDVKFSRLTKYALLAAGLFTAFVISSPLLVYVYPPAIIGREIHEAVYGFFDRAESVKPGLWLGGFTAMSLFILGVAAFELLVSRRWWCRYVCPGGAVYCALGSKRLLRVKLNVPKCTKCGECNRVCPMGIEPMNGEFGAECYNCGRCISWCEDDAIDYGLSLPNLKGRAKTAAAIALAIVLFTATDASAHHILGLPHYTYDETYPQAPVLTYKVDAGPYELKMTGYPGKPIPGEMWSVHVYLARKDNTEVFDGMVNFTAMSDGIFDKGRVIYGPMMGHLEHSVYVFHPTFAREGNYTARVEFTIPGDPIPWKVDLPIVAGEPGSPFKVVGGYAAALIGFVIVIRAIHIKRKRALAGKQITSVDSPEAGGAAA